LDCLRFCWYFQRKSRFFVWRIEPGSVMQIRAVRRWCTPVAASSILWLFIPALCGQVSLDLASGSANSGGTISLTLSLTATPGDEPAGVQWTLAYPAGDLSLLGITAGPALASAGKSLYCNQRIGITTCLGVGQNQNIINSGVIATVAVSVASKTATSVLPLTLGGVAAVLPNGNAIAAGGASGGVTVSGWQSPVPAYFTDVAPSDPYYAAANLLYAAGISNGCGANPLMYCPDRGLTRQEMATLLVRAVGGDPTSYNAVPYFADVPSSNPYFAWIQKLYELGITSGCSANPLMFCPTDPVTREQMAAFTIHGRYGPAIPFQYSTLPYFTDVAPNDSFFTSIQKITELGVTGCTPVSFCATQAITRGDTALFVVKGLLNQLLPIGTPMISLVSPAVGTRGGPVVTVFIVGGNTHFSADTTLNAGAGVTVSGVAALNPQTLVANLTVLPTATPGRRSLIATTGSEDAVLPNGLTIQ